MPLGAGAGRDLRLQGVRSRSDRHAFTGSRITYGGVDEPLCCLDSGYRVQGDQGVTHMDDGTAPRRADTACGGGRLGVQRPRCLVVACLERHPPGEGVRLRGDRLQAGHQRLGHSGVEQSAARLDDRCEQELHAYERHAPDLPVHIADCEAHRGEQTLIEP
jgi:hypothetical protein